jgi:hypothetical protein
MNNASDPAFHSQVFGQQVFDQQAIHGQAPQGQGLPEGAPGVLKAMSPGVVDFLFRQLVAGETAEDVQWHQEGTVLSAQAPGSELARRLAETDLEALTPTELFHYVRAAQRLSAWAESLREAAVGRYCATPSGGGTPAA